MGSLQTSSQVSTLKSLRPSVLDRACKVLEELATSTNHRPSGHCRAWAETAFSPLLGAFVVRAGENDWPSASKQADPRADSDHSWRESLVACATHPRRVTKTRNRGFGTNRLPHSAHLQTTTVTDLGRLSYRTTSGRSLRPISSPCRRSDCGCCSCSLFWNIAVEGCFTLESRGIPLTNG